MGQSRGRPQLSIRAAFLQLLSLLLQLLTQDEGLQVLVDVRLLRRRDDQLGRAEPLRVQELGVGILGDGLLDLLVGEGIDPPLVGAALHLLGLFSRFSDGTLLAHSLALSVPK